MAVRRDAYEAQHAKNRLVYERQVKRIFTEVCYECGMTVTQLEAIVKNAGENASFAQIPAVRRVLDKLQRKLAERLNMTVVNGVRAEWKLANDKYDALVGTMVAGDLWEQMDAERKARTMARNAEALEAFLKRKEGGLDLSQRVWNYTGQMRDAMEVALELGISEGQSAAEIARELKQYLIYPDKLFRRVRDEETGELKISHPASLFHPGQGVYRSSYKNALRLALNETNIAYRKSDSIRRVGLDFVVGIEVHLSNNHNCVGIPEGEFHDICDELAGKYPPDFEFVGWHPNCRCWTSTILQDEDEFFRDSDGIYRGSKNEVKDVPPQFKRWLDDNADRIERAEKAGKLPYFLRDNQWAWKDDAPRSAKERHDALLAAEARHKARTDELVAAIKDRWAERKRAVRGAERAQRLIESVPGMREYLNGIYPGSVSVIYGEENIKGDYGRLMNSAVVLVRTMKHLRGELSVLDNPWEVLKEHGVEKTIAAKDAVEKKLALWEDKPLEYQLKKLRFEAQWIEDNKKGVLSTWKVAQDAYLKAAREVEWRIEWEAIFDRLNALAVRKNAIPELVAEARSFIGKDKAAAEAAIERLQEAIEIEDINEQYDSYLKDYPNAVNPAMRKSFNAAYDNRDLAELRSTIAFVQAAIEVYKDKLFRANSLMSYLNDAGVKKQIAEAIKTGGVFELTEAVALGERAYKFQNKLEDAKTLLNQNRDTLLKLNAKAVADLENAFTPKTYDDSELVRLHQAYDLCRSLLNVWYDALKQFNDEYAYYQTGSSEYKALVKEARDAAKNIDLAALTDVITQLKEKKEYLEKERLYKEGIEAEWEKMKAEIGFIRDALNKDSDLLSKAAAAGLVLLISEFDGNASGPRKMREARKTYKAILESAKKLNIDIASGEIFTDGGVRYGPGLRSVSFSDDNFTQKRKDKALWYKSIDASRKKYQPIAQVFYDAASADEKNAQYKYTSGSGYMNRPLRGYDDNWSTFKGIGQVPLDNEETYAQEHIKALTEFIDRCSYDFDVWIQRGIESDAGLKGFLGIQDLDEKTVQSTVGKTVTDLAFVSCGSSKGSGFSGHILNIYCPKGTKMLYVDGHSAFNGKENETIIQRNTQFRITQVERGYHWYYIDVEVVGQM